MRRAPCAGSTRLSSLASTSTREPGWMSVQCACQVCVVSARVWRGCREGGHARATSITSSVAAGERAGCTMRHEPRGSCALTLRMGESDNCPNCRLLFRVAEYAESAENNVRGEGVTTLLLSFLGFKIPRQQSPPTYLKVAHNTERKKCPSVARVSTTFLALYLWDGKE